MVLLLLTVVRGDLMDQWQASLPASAPNRFVINIQPEEAEAVAERLGIGKYFEFDDIEDFWEWQLEETGVKLADFEKTS